MLEQASTVHRVLLNEYQRKSGREVARRAGYTGLEYGRIEASGAKRAWIYFNNDFEAYAPSNARSMSRLLK